MYGSTFKNPGNAIEETTLSTHTYHDMSQTIRIDKLEYKAYSKVGIYSII